MDVDRHDRPAAADEGLEDVGHARALEPLGAASGQLSMDRAQRRGAGGGEHRHADELAVRLLGRDLGADADDAAPALGRDEAPAVGRRLGHDQIQRAGREAQARAVGVVEGAIDHHRHVGLRLQQLHQDGGVEEDVAVEEDEGPVELAFGAEQGADLARLGVAVVVDEAEPRERDPLLPVASHHDHVAHATVAERLHLPLEDGATLHLEHRLRAVLDEGQELRLEAGRQDDGAGRLVAGEEEALLVRLELGNADESVDVLERHDAVIDRSGPSRPPELPERVAHGDDRGAERLVGEDRHPEPGCR